VSVAEPASPSTQRRGGGGGEGALRILFVSHYAVPHVGGMETAIDALARELSRRGHAVTHLASTAGAEAARTEGDPGYRLVRVPAWNALERRAGVPYPLFAPTLWPALNREVGSADVVHGHGFLYMSTLAALRRARRPGRDGRAPVRVLTEHVGHVDYEPEVLDRLERAAIATLGRLAARSAEALVVYNDKVDRELRALGVHAPIHHILNGVDTGRYRPAEPEERAALRRGLGWDERPRALFVGRLVAKKGLDLAVEAARRAQVPLAVAGSGDARRVAGPGVEVLGALPRERVAELYRAADLLLLPSRGEGFPLTAQEALASGLPVVLGDDPAYAANVAGAAEAVRLVAPDAERVAAAVRELVDDPDRRAAASGDGVRHARRAFSWARAADEHERLYRELGERRRKLAESRPPSLAR